MRMKNAYEHVYRFDIAGLKRFIAKRRPEVWNDPPEERSHAFRNAETIRLIFNANRKTRWFEPGDSVWWRDDMRGIIPHVTPIFDFVKARYDGVIVAAVIIRARPGGSVSPYTCLQGGRYGPGGSYVESERWTHPSYLYAHRLHLAIETQPGGIVLGGETVELEEGELVEYDNMRVHAADNTTGGNKVYMIFDVISGDDFDKVAAPRENIGGVMTSDFSDLGHQVKPSAKPASRDR